ncbi:MAG: sulfotransferase domain-containing protein [Pseudomonadota bacterium]
MDQFALTDLPLRHYQHRVWDNARWEGFAHRPGDILVCTPYKAGTTWTQMICALLIFQTPDLPKPLAEISPWMELRAVEAEVTHAVYAAQTHRRFIKTHTALDGLRWQPEARYVVVQRDPRDVFMSMMNQMTNSNPDADAIFVREKKVSGAGRTDLPEEPNALFRHWLTHGIFAWESDGAPYWSVFRHGYSFWQHRAEANMHLMHYADLKADLEGEMRCLAAFLEIEVAEALWPSLVEAAGFAAMKRRADRTAPDTNFNMWTDNARFFNKGSSGQWEGVLTAESLALLAEVTERYPEAYTEWLFQGGATG